MTLLKAEGWEAIFSHEDEPSHYRSVVFWILEGASITGLVDGDKGFRDAESFTNFKGFRESDDLPRIVIPAPPGWWAIWQDKETPTEAFWDAIIGWSLQRDGWGVQALTTPDGYGYSEPTVASETCRFRYDPTLLVAPTHWPWDDNDE